MPAEHWPVSNEEYHADRECLSHTGGDTFRDDPALYYGKYITGEFADSDTPALQFGRDYDDAVFCEQGIGENIVEIPADALSANGQRRGKAWTQFVEENVGKVLVKPDDPLLLMLRQLKAHPGAMRLIDKTQHQFSIRWDDEEFGVRRKCRFDGFGAGFFHIDLKTTVSTDPKSFASSAWRFGYHRQVAWYLDGAEAYLMDGEETPFIFVAQQKTPPYSVRLYQLDQEMVDVGEEQNAAILREFAKCRDSGDWTREGWNRIVTLGMPRWAKYEQEWEVTT